VNRVVVIGAGVGGLTTAALLARTGLDVTVLEAHVYAGGCAGTFYHQGYRFDAGATLPAGFYPGRPMDLVAQAVGIDRWPVRCDDPAMVVHLAGGTSVTRYAGERRWEERQRAFGREAEPFWRWQESTSDALWAMVLRGIGREILMVDPNRERAQAEADGIFHAVPVAHSLQGRAGEYSDLAGSRVVVLAAGVSMRPGESRLQLLERNAAIFADVVPKVLAYAPDAILMVATNPVDIMTHLAARYAGVHGVPPTRLIGSGTTLNTARFRVLLGRHLGVDPAYPRVRRGRTRRFGGADLVAGHGGRYAADRVLPATGGDP
jgi:glycine/D-amino acid oxidase-like deaminating enzyme